MRLTTTVLTGLGLVVLTLSAPADMGSRYSTIRPPTAWENTQTKKYHCEGKDIICCETNREGICFAIDLCEAYCFNYHSGASCIDMGAPVVVTSNDIDSAIPKTSILANFVKVATRDTSPQENMHYSCSRNHASVLICKYGFCSTDHYCRSGNECRDNCNCCKSVSPLAQGAKSEVRATLKDAAISLVPRSRSPKSNVLYVCSKDRASVLKCDYGFCATDYYCAKHHPCLDKHARCKKALNARD